MPQRNKDPSGNKKKKKGRTPAHQNSFPFKHNPGSKLTDKIISSPNVGVCKKCYDKIEWRKKFRKYKPLSQPAICNKCKRRNIKAAYHTICSGCSKIEVKVAPCTEAPDEQSSTDEREPPSCNTAVSQTVTRRIKVCEVCAKEPVTPNSNDRMNDDLIQLEKDIMEKMSSGGNLTLRQKKTLERKLQKLEIGNNGDKGKKDKKDSPKEKEELDGKHDSDNQINKDLDSVEEEDPFLKAVGGNGMPLTGEAFQRMRLQRESENQDASVMVCGD